ncbi:hypothetical protein [Mesorhizobium sp. M0701]|uniref:hypothetical protein n=1 Tax=Mesorhizobium sp. M0701 TaxID=2956989 RepID=UPI00333C46B4
MACAERHAFIRRDYREYLGFRFKEPEHAEAMAWVFGDETYYALDRSKGSGWDKWRKNVKRRPAS